MEVVKVQECVENNNKKYIYINGKKFKYIYIYLQHMA